jgi:hypothetical protein
VHATTSSQPATAGTRHPTADGRMEARAAADRTSSGQQGGGNCRRRCGVAGRSAARQQRRRDQRGGEWSSPDADDGARRGRAVSDRRLSISPSHSARGTWATPSSRRGRPRCPDHRCGRR